MTNEENILAIAAYLNKRVKGIPGTDVPEGTLNVTFTLSKTLAAKWRDDLIAAGLALEAVEAA